MKLFILAALAVVSFAGPSCNPGGTPPGGPSAHATNPYVGAPPPLSLDAATTQAMQDGLDSALSWLQGNFPPNFRESDSSVFMGAGGRALLFLRLAQNHPEESDKYLTLAQEYIGAAMDNTPPNQPQFVGFLKGLPGLQAVAAAVYLARGDQASAAKMVSEIQNTFDTGVSTQSRWNFDQGLAGLLYTNLFLQATFGSDTVLPRASVSKVVNLLYSKGYMNATTNAFEFGPGVRNDLGFLGVGVGYSGPNLVLMHYLDMITDPAAAANLRSTMHYYVSIQSPDGNMPSDYPSRIQWCHGAPGFVAVFLKGWYVFQDETFLAAAKLAATFTEANGVILKGMQLGHGISGNAYAVSLVGRATGADTLWVRKSLGMHLTALSQWTLTSMNNMTVYDCQSGSTWVDGPGSMAFAYSDWLSNKDDLAKMLFVQFPAFGEVLHLD